MIMRLLCAGLLVATISMPTFAAAPTPKAFVNQSLNDLSIICTKILKDTVAYGTRMVYITDDEARGSKILLRQNLAWRTATTQVDTDRIMQLHTWLRNLPLEYHYEHIRWCRDAGETIYISLPQQTKAKINKESEEEFLRLRLNRELKRDPM